MGVVSIGLDKNILLGYEIGSSTRRSRFEVSRKLGGHRRTETYVAYSESELFRVVS